MPRTKGNRIIPAAPIGRILQSAGEKRASADAIETLANILEEKAKEIGKMALEMSKHAGRKTIHEDDIKLAIKKV